MTVVQKQLSTRRNPPAKHVMIRVKLEIWGKAQPEFARRRKSD